MMLIVLLIMVKNKFKKGVKMTKKQLIDFIENEMRENYNNKEIFDYLYKLRKELIMGK